VDAHVLCAEQTARAIGDWSIHRHPRQSRRPSPLRASRRHRSTGGDQVSRTRHRDRLRRSPAVCAAVITPHKAQRASPLVVDLGPRPQRPSKRGVGDVVFRTPDGASPMPGTGRRHRPSGYGRRGEQTGASQPITMRACQARVFTNPLARAPDRAAADSGNCDSA